MAESIVTGGNGEKYWIYRLSNNEIDTYLLGLLKNSKIDGTLLVDVEEIGKDTILRYNIKECRILNDYVRVFDKNWLLNVYKSICTILMNAEEYMIEYAAFLIDSEHVYIDDEGNIKLICIPNKKDTNKPLSKILKEFLTSLIINTNEDVSYVVNLLNYFNQNETNLCEFAKMLDDMLGDSLYTSTSLLKKSELEEESSIEINLDENEEEQVASTSNEIQTNVNNVQFDNLSNDNYSNQVDKINTFNNDYNNQIDKINTFNDNYNNQVDKINAFNADYNNQANNLSEVNDNYNNQFVNINPLGDDINNQNNNTLHAQDNAMQPMNNGYGQIPFDIGLEELEQNINMQNSLQDDIETDFVDINNIDEEVNEKPKKRGLFGFGKKKHKETKKEQEYYEMPQNENIGDKTTVLSDIISEPRLIRLCNSEVIYIDKSVYKIGKDPTFADYCLNDNPAISRSHAEIIVDNGNYYVLDNNSLNHTYVDNCQIDSQLRVPISDGTIIRLANEEFEFRI